MYEHNTLWNGCNLESAASWVKLATAAENCTHWGSLKTQAGSQPCGPFCPRRLKPAALIFQLKKNFLQHISSAQDEEPSPACSTSLPSAWRMWHSSLTLPWMCKCPVLMWTSRRGLLNRFFCLFYFKWPSQNKTPYYTHFLQRRRKKAQQMFISYCTDVCLIYSELVVWVKCNSKTGHVG